MHAARNKIIALLICFVLLTILPGCTNWKKEYEALLVENENLNGLLARERSEKGLLADEVTVLVQPHKSVQAGLQCGVLD